jgi:2-oxoacid:acceptor oxidoreductase delta subunit (pyruvate/2-ketoisovalerate family)
MKREPAVEKEYIAPVGEGLYTVNTGDWRTQYPHIRAEVCRACGRCLMYCPVNAVRREAGEGARRGGVYRIDLSYCKGCGICAHECPEQAIEMKKESPR